VNSPPNFPPGYNEARLGCAFYPIPDPGYLRITGQDRISFLQRQTTNDIHQISLEHVLPTVLTAPNARILDLLTLIEEPESIRAITLPGYASETAAFLKNRIFFVDKVSLDDQSADFKQIDLFGPGIFKILINFGLDAVPDQYAIRSIEIEATQVQVIGLGKRYLRLLFPSSVTKSLENILTQSGATRLKDEIYNILLVESGIPQAGKELTDQYTPLEVNLEGLISDHKGCYTGQEVIARQLTYDKVTQRLVGLKLTSPATSGDKVYPVDQDRSVGTITSVALSPRFGPIALAIIKRPLNQIGSEVSYKYNGSTWRAIVSDLPFS
jgi:tRNA-modifying protein YgfZ